MPVRPLDLRQPDAAAPDELLALRELARRNYRDYLRYWMLASRQRILWNWHLDYLADIMEAVRNREIRRLIVNIPPRHMKSTILSQQFQPWMIGVDNSTASSVLSIGVGADLASRDSRKSLNTIRSDWYKTLFPNVELLRENEADWETTTNCTRIAVGVSGQITGRGAAHLIVDDPLKAQEADSELVREDTNSWLGETLATRHDDPKTGTTTIIMQRLHERDPTGYLMELARKHPDIADQYQHIVIPLEAPTKTVVQFNQTTYATREKGSLLHPLRIGRKEADALKVSMGINYEGQYQQNPTKMTGGLLDPRKIIRLPESSRDLQRRLGLTPNFYLDLATTEKQTHKDDPDYSVIIAAAKDQMGRLIILDLWRGQVRIDAFARTLVEMHKLIKPRFVRPEKGGIYNALVPMLEIQQRLLGHFFNTSPLDAPSSLGDKVQRSLSLQNLLNSGVVCAPANAPWLALLESEMRSFPRGSHDDQVDALAYAALDYHKLPKGSAPTADPRTSDPDSNAALNFDRIKRIEARRDLILEARELALAEAE